MKYLISNFYLTQNPLLEHQFSEEKFKTCGYNAKIKNKISKQVSFNYVLIPLLDYVPTTDLEITENYSRQHSSYNPEKSVETYSIMKFLDKTVNEKYTFDIITTVDDTKLDIFYSDGSSSKSCEAASYATIKLLGESYENDAVYDEVSNKSQKIKIISGRIENGTNNIGELTGIQTAIKNAGWNKIQVIVSDSEYSLKCFREWIYNWKDNGYRGSNKKEILNCELIKTIQQSIEDSDKIFIFKWLKGHNHVPLNEICDRMAKQELGL